MKNWVTSPPTGILPPMPIGQSHASNAANDGQNAGNAPIEDDAMPDRSDRTARRSPSSRAPLTRHAQCLHARLDFERRNQEDLRSTQGNFYKTAIDFTRRICETRQIAFEPARSPQSARVAEFTRIIRSAALLQPLLAREVLILTPAQGERSLTLLTIL